jgi:hypothetical protein
MTQAQNSKRKARGTKRAAPRDNARERRLRRLRQAYHEFLDGRGRCDIAIGGPDPRDDGRVVMYCHSHNYTWSGHASETNGACPKARE